MRPARRGVRAGTRGPDPVGGPQGADRLGRSRARPTRPCTVAGPTADGPNRAGPLASPGFTGPYSVLRAASARRRTVRAVGRRRVLRFAAAARHGPGGTSRRGPGQVRGDARDADPRYVYHGRVVRRNGWIVLHYLYFYFMNDYRSTFQGANDHEADWEQVFVYLDDAPDGPRPVWIAAAATTTRATSCAAAGTTRPLEQGRRPPGHLRGRGLARLVLRAGRVPDRAAAARRPRRTAPPRRAAQLLARHPPPARPGRPRRGTGRRAERPVRRLRPRRRQAIGPDGDVPWTPSSSTTTRPWVDGYRGLFGLDTYDRFGGERRPAGPKYSAPGPSASPGTTRSASRASTRSRRRHANPTSCEHGSSNARRASRARRGHRATRDRLCRVSSSRRGAWPPMARWPRSTRHVPASWPRAPSNSRACGGSEPGSPMRWWRCVASWRASRRVTSVIRAATSSTHTDRSPPPTCSTGGSSSSGRR